jgi:signal transduction histidine kinase
MSESIDKGMLGGFSREVINYILNKIPPYLGLFVIRTSDVGIVKYFIGPWDKYLNTKPIQGALLEECVPILYGMVPPIVNPMVVSHLNVSNNRYADVHVYADQEGDVWIFFIDQTRQVEIIHPIVQLFNQERLEQRTEKRRSGTSETLSALYLLDFLGFERRQHGYFQIGKSPYWFSSLNIEYRPKGMSFPLIETFPYLEVFELEAERIWSSNEDDKLVSDIWQEVSKTGETIYLQALALNYDKRNFLLIKPLVKGKDLNDSFLQKAREQKLTLDQLASTEKKLKELLEFKDQFVSIISHDLRSPIGAVIGLIDLLLTDQVVQNKLETEQIELITDIKSEMFRLLDYNDKLFQWSNLELGNFKVRAKSFPVENLAKYVEKMQKTKFEQKQISFVTKIDSSLTINADETLMGHALNNLAGNSVKFTPPGGKITIMAFREGEFITISVSDTGVGMDQKTADNLFNSFTRKSTMGTYGEQGTGLGLGIVKKILDAHDYSIKVVSEVGKGSTFSIQIPVATHLSD